jgi:hypothetical protein
MMDAASSEEPTKKWASIADRLNPNRAAHDAEFKAKWKTMEKLERNRLLAVDRKTIRALQKRGAVPLPFEADAGDHCETSPTAYSHVAPLLLLVAQRLGKEPKDLQIYDPYFCAGGMVQHLKALGFENVYNVAEDFYQVIAEGRVPAHDVVITNPPYSGDHFDRFLDFLKCNNNKPCFFLLPDHFSEKPAYQEANKTWSKDAVAHLSTPERYHYWTPDGRRPASSSSSSSSTKNNKNKHRNLYLGSRNSPARSHWFVCMGSVMPRKKLLKLARVKKEDNNNNNAPPAELVLVTGCTLSKEYVYVQAEQRENDEERPKKKRRKNNKSKKKDDDSKEE